MEGVTISRERSRANPDQDVLLIEGDSSDLVQAAFWNSVDSVCVPLNSHLPKQTGDGKWILQVRLPRNAHIAEPLRSIVNDLT